MSLFASVQKFFLDLLFPIFCLGCHKEGTWLCENCFSKIKIKKEQTCPSCGHKTFFGEFCDVCSTAFKLNGVIVAASYKNELLKSAIHTFKYHFAKELALPLGELLIHTLLENQIFLNLFDSQNTILVPVPLHKSRLRWRGFNQAELLARQVSEKFGLPIFDNLILRRKNTTPQTQLKNILERKENVLDAFTAKQVDKIKNKNIILIDDVATTCATLEECAKVLSPGRPKQIWGLVLAKG